MLSISLHRALLSVAAPAMLCLSASSAQAQPNAEASTSAAPALQYQSAIAGYRKFDDQPVAPWVQVNDTVGTIGGWRVYAKESRAPDPVSADKAAPSSRQNTLSDPAKGVSRAPMNHGAQP